MVLIYSIWVWFLRYGCCCLWKFFLPKCISSFRKCCGQGYYNLWGYLTILKNKGNIVPLITLLEELVRTAVSEDLKFLYYRTNSSEAVSALHRIL